MQKWQHVTRRHLEHVRRTYDTGRTEVSYISTFQLPVFVNRNRSNAPFLLKILGHRQKHIYDIEYQWSQSMGKVFGSLVGGRLRLAFGGRKKWNLPAVNISSHVVRTVFFFQKQFTVNETFSLSLFPADPADTPPSIPFSTSIMIDRQSECPNMEENPACCLTGEHSSEPRRRTSFPQHIPTTADRCDVWSK
jgi:hypothetical protein